MKLVKDNRHLAGVLLFVVAISTLAVVTDAGPCDVTPYPCYNGGTCVNDTYGVITCQCLAGWSGIYCESVAYVDPCSSSPCKFGGTCITSVNIFICNCVACYTGKKCQTPIIGCVGPTTVDITNAATTIGGEVLTESTVVTELASTVINTVGLSTSTTNDVATTSGQIPTTIATMTAQGLNGPHSTYGEMFHRYQGAHLDSVAPLANATVLRSPVECCALCRKIPGCKSVNFRRRRSTPAMISCVPLNQTVPTVGFQQMAIDADWDWFYTEV